MGSWVSGMPRKSVNLDDDEYRQVEELKHKLNLTDREIYLRGLGIHAHKRKMGRPKKRSLRFLGALRDDENESFKNQVCRS